MGGKMSSAAKDEHWLLPREGPAPSTCCAQKTTALEAGPVVLGLPWRIAFGRTPSGGQGAVILTYRPGARGWTLSRPEEGSMPL